MIPYVKFWKRQKCGHNKKISSCQGLGLRGGINRTEGRKASLYHIIMMNTCHYMSVQTHTMYSTTDCTAPRMNAKINYRLWGIMMQQCRFGCCNKCTIVVGDVDHGVGYLCVQTGTKGYSLYFPLFKMALRKNAFERTCFQQF